ncbi:MAG: deoxynucleoside kinase [Candidatus Omnitrophica bacterium]|jgi:diacylglycerol kinase family enzyme/thymidylate kinase|nr:deoxynucleoside kinase [Candidatus Omnitrophota bacterium]
MTTKKPLHIAIVGIDGSGKSSCYEDLLLKISADRKVAGVGDKVLVSIPGAGLVTPQDIVQVKLKSSLGVIVRMCHGKFLYEISKLSELVLRSKIQNTIAKRYKPQYIITDGSALVNILGWGRYFHPQYFNEKMYVELIAYLTGKKKISFLKAFYYAKRIPELVLINRIYSACLQVPDIIIFLKVKPEVAIQRILARGKEVQVHEQTQFLSMLQEAYSFVCKLLSVSFPVKIVEIDTDGLTKEEVTKHCQDVLDKNDSPAKVNIVATTISGSIKDWKKLDSMESEFKRYIESSKVFIEDSHKDAFETTRNLVKQGAKIIVSAGGAGTFNSVLEGCCCSQALPADLRLAFLRKGSADLIGKVLNIPDELEPAVKIISEGIIKDKTIESDVLEVEARTTSGEIRKYHMIGFGGVGVFGDIPYFTESRFIKYYKGFLGYLFGDRGPFLTGANLALFKRYLDKIRGKNIKFRIVADGIDIPFKKYMNIIIMNGDLGKHFPIARGIPLGSGDFQVTLMEDKGPISAYKQMLHAWKGGLESHKEELGVYVFRTNKLKIIPDSNYEYFLNLDGLLKKTAGPVEYSVFSKVKLVTA